MAKEICEGQAVRVKTAIIEKVGKHCHIHLAPGVKGIALRDEWVPHSILGLGTQAEVLVETSPGVSLAVIVPRASLEHAPETLPVEDVDGTLGGQ